MIKDIIMILFIRKGKVLSVERFGKKVKAFVEDFDSKGQKQIFVENNEALAFFPGKVTGKGSSSSQAGDLDSPMPGKIFKILLSEGDEVKEGDSILIMEAMKMEHVIKSPVSGTIKKMYFSEGEQVSGGQQLCEIES